ncbi:uncharacterized protein BX663DRAFT_521201 [Cokeromyces recurvatus]|uniref:uncharacterized protein n=1 Tax=Cokeromyces recurvatus TaxID=90255 RepID=UPI0022212912|nr:uncharacterized protein BX663DRAFT_521201 [Cokeromyces recurvatus]KAI7899529.1 hypothetical protein BX663DRAFT_521201 [Cokeromyces recurvatus]
MSGTNSQKDDIMNYAAIINETLLPHNNHHPELQLSIQDLLCPTEIAENLLETLSNEQLNLIEQALHKIKERKKNNLKLVYQKDEIQQGNGLEDSFVATHSQGTRDNNNNNNNKRQQQALMTTAINRTSKLSQQRKTKQQQQQQQQQQQPLLTANTSPFLTNHETTTEIKEGVEWVSFIYSHHRVLRRYCIRTDIEKVDTSILDDKFKQENCVYPRANLPKEAYQGNRWTYETECNVLGWKLAYLNPEEIAGKRGLIQRAVDSYRNRYPSMRSRRVARQEKLLKGTLRKRKHREMNEDSHKEQLEKALPKTILIEDPIGSINSKCRIRINIDSVVLDSVDMTFRKNNCVFPRAIHITSDTPSVSQRRREEAKCNEIGWKLAWLNPRQLANKKNLLQRVLDIYRAQFASTELKPRKYASRIPLIPTLLKKEETIQVKEENTRYNIPLTERALADQQRLLSSESSIPINKHRRRNSSSTDPSCYSGTTVTLDFHDYCFSPPPSEEDTIQDLSTTTVNNNHLFPTATTSSTTSMLDNLIFNMTCKPINHHDETNNGTTAESQQDNLNDIYQTSLLIDSTTRELNTPSMSVIDVLLENNSSKGNELSLVNNNENQQQILIDLITKYGKC